MTKLPLGTWPARNARMGDIVLTPAVLEVRNPSGHRDEAILVGDCPPGNYQDKPHECTAEANGYHWAFQGLVVNTRLQGNHLRVRIDSEGAITTDTVDISG